MAKRTARVVDASASMRKPAQKPSWIIPGLDGETAAALAEFVDSGELTLMNALPLMNLREWGVPLTAEIVRNVLNHPRGMNYQPPMPRVDPHKHDPLVYYVRCGDLIKIGTTTKLSMRLAAYPPFAELLATEPGGYDVERARHKQFAEHHAMRNEWFTAADDLLAHIATLAESA